MKCPNTTEDMGVSEKGPKADYRLNVWKSHPESDQASKLLKPLFSMSIDLEKFVRDIRFPTN